MALVFGAPLMLLYCIEEFTKMIFSKVQWTWSSLLKSHKIFIRQN